MGYQNTISGKEFCKKNCGSVGKDLFYEEYYRILHTCYLRAKDESCIDLIRQEFHLTFGIELDRESISYIYATAKYFVYDVVISSLLNDGRIDSKYYYSKLAIEIGFDVWLIRCMEQHKPINTAAFLSWLPLEKSDKTERAVNDFWNFKLPKNKDFQHIYLGLVEYRSDILSCYRKLINKNTAFEDDREAVNLILHYLDEELTVVSSADASEELIIKEPVTLDESATIPGEEHSTSGESDTVSEEGTALNKSFELPDENKLPNSEPYYNTDEILFDSIMAVDHSSDQRYSAVNPKRVTVNFRQDEKEKTNKILETKNSKERTKGFCDQKCNISKETLITAAKCVAVAGLLLVPLIAYQCLKKKK